VKVSQLRDRVGRSVLGLLGAGMIIGGAAGTLGWHATGSPLFDIIRGLGVLAGGLWLLGIARTGKVPGREDAGGSL